MNFILAWKLYLIFPIDQEVIYIAVLWRLSWKVEICEIFSRYDRIYCENSFCVIGFFNDFFLLSKRKTKALKILLLLALHIFI
jgi:hypothetical protein